ncbi:hypothetical protein CYMTET_15203, partial [Cymbomonas tetramitiformis]
GSQHFRSMVKTAGGAEMFPFLRDNNTGCEMYESADIVKYLYTTYGGGSAPPAYLLPSTLITGWLPSLLRPGRGMSRFEGSAPELPGELLVLYSYDGNQFARLVREVLCELELPYTMKSAGKGSPMREQLKELSGKTQVPYLVDPNTGKAISDSADIIEYLYATYSKV